MGFLAVGFLEKCLHGLQSVNLTPEVLSYLMHTNFHYPLRGWNDNSTKKNVLNVFHSILGCHFHEALHVEFIEWGLVFE